MRIRIRAGLLLSSSVLALITASDRSVAQTELPEVKVEAPKQEASKPPAKPAVVAKPAPRQEAVAPRRVAAPKPAVAPKPAPQVDRTAGHGATASFARANCGASRATGDPDDAHFRSTAQRHHQLHGWRQFLRHHESEHREHAGWDKHAARQGPVAGARRDPKFRRERSPAHSQRARQRKLSVQRHFAS